MKEKEKEKEKRTGARSPENRTVRYTFRLTQAEDAELKRQMEKAGCRGNASRYIVGRILN